MTYDELIKEIKSNTETSENEMAIISAVDAYLSASNNGNAIVSGALPPSVPEDEVWTELSDNFRKVAHCYKDGHFDYRYVWAWFQEQQLKYDLKRRQ